ncbi:MAG TPA: crotonase/enoyl-CoA hydratase family protein [Henriciella marina]|uniref:Enoyl-CoA hydratase n=1 Tax=Henriciella algicola TaxID=1608422 RepID=A0A399RGB1_9PROT|nr:MULTISPECIES: crotonase/enoyl-CoA hydratase family protein [Henriciella]RIJ29581.1 enoyl-CoA hydratase [Henriciella algicola]HIG21884.1 crotonase/enoyl-CoA hydratase family protein [Henriciella sp.]HIK63462.1 crotonase/enoyl-CoA hydratase family protein [Henriciella marina]
MSDKPESVGNEVTYEVKDHVAVVTLNRPDKRNAVNGAVASALGWICEETERDDDVRACILTSSLESTFCAGADLSEISKGNAGALSTKKGGFAGFVKFPRTKPWIAAVRGNALAGGCELPLACDMIVAADDSRFGLPEVKRGIFAGAGGVFRLPRALPRNIALEIVATGDPLPAERLYQLGLVNRMVASDKVLDEAKSLAAQIGVNAPLAVRKSLEVARQAYDGTESDLWKASNEASAIVFSSEDAKEGPRAFLEKRAPVWKGK